NIKARHRNHLIKGLALRFPPHRCVSVSLCLISKWVSQREEYLEFRSWCSIRIVFCRQGDSEVQTCWSEGCLIPKTEPHSVSKLRQLNVRNTWKYIPCVIKQRTPEPADGKCLQRETVFDVSDHHCVSTLQI